MGDWNASIDQTLPGLSSVVTGAIYNPNDRSGTIDQTLAGLQITHFWGKFKPGAVIGTIDQTLPGLSSVLRGIANAEWHDELNPVDAATTFSDVVEPMLTDSVETADSLIDGFTEKLTDSVETVDSFIAETISTSSVTDSVQTVDSSIPGLTVELISDSVETADSSAAIGYDAVSDSVETDDNYAPWSPLETLVDSVQTVDHSAPGGDTGYIYSDSVTDSVETQDSLGELVVVLEVLSDSVQVVDAVIHYAGALDSVLDVVAAVDLATSAPSIINSAVSDPVYAIDAIYSADPASMAWILNAETGAPWFYTNYQFNDVVFHSGILLGGAQDGLYVLEGEDDSGVEIDSELITGMLDFDSNQKKRIPYIYFGYTGQELEVDVETCDEDEPNDIYTYGMDNRNAAAPRNNRIQLGKGLSSRYWRFTIRNLAGVAYQVYNTVADVVISKRRL